MMNTNQYGQIVWFTELVISCHWCCEESDWSKNPIVLVFDHFYEESGPQVGQNGQYVGSQIGQGVGGVAEVLSGNGCTKHLRWRYKTSCEI